jgi:hypothetical protein
MPGRVALPELLDELEKSYKFDGGRGLAQFETEPIRVTAPADLGLLPDAHEQVQDDCHIDPDNRGLKDARFVHYFIDFKRKK